MTELFKFLKTKVFIINLLIVVVLLVALLGFTYRWLDKYTKHGETISVPDVRGLQPDKVKEFLSDKHLQFQIIDSMYDAKRPKGSVIDQDPIPDAKVKENRTIYLTINSNTPPHVKMPNLIDVSLRQAEAIMQTYGLKVGELIYKPDLAKNAVLEQLYRGNEIKPGVVISKGALIDLVLGDGIGTQDAPVPNLVGSTLIEALTVLKGSSLNKGAVVADATVRDSSIARVYKQVPEYSEGATINQGESIDLYITQSPEKYLKETGK